MTEEEIREKARHKSPNELLDERVSEEVRQAKMFYRGR